jgi:hypothetical protein
MGLGFHRRQRIGRSTFFNLYKSGASLSKRFRPLTLSSRGRGSLRLGRGFSWRFKR